MIFIDETHLIDRILRLSHIPPTELTGRYRKLPQVGFRGLKAYHKQALDELNKKADEMAARIDEIKGRGLGVLNEHKKVLDAVDLDINEMNEMVREGSNGAPLSG